MKDKCQKFESLFIFSNEEELNLHIENCENCKIEKEKMDKISNLIQEAKPLYFNKQKHFKTQFKAACALFLTIISISVFSVLNYNQGIVETYKYGQTLSAEDYGFPVDSYGLIMVGE